MSMPIHEHDLELLSAYIDNQLSEADKTRLEGRLRTEPELKETLAGLRATVRALRGLPEVNIPRSFALDPKIYGSRRPAAGFASFYGILRLGTALATVLFVVALAGDFLTRSGAQELAAPEAAMAPAPAEQAVLASDTPDGTAAQSAPAEAATGEADLAATEAANAQGPTPATGLYLEGPPPGGEVEGAPGVGGGGGGGGGEEPAAPPEAAASLAETPTPDGARQAVDTTAVSATPEAATKSAGEETQTGIAEAGAATETAPTPAAAMAAQPQPAALGWLRTAEIGLAALAVSLGLAALWYRARR